MGRRVSGANTGEVSTTNGGLVMTKFGQFISPLFWG